MAFREALSVFLETLRSEQELARKRKQFLRLNRETLNYPLIQQIVEAAAKQQPGFFSTLTFSDGTKWDFGVREKAQRVDGEAF